MTHVAPPDKTEDVDTNNNIDNEATKDDTTTNPKKLARSIIQQKMKDDIIAFYHSNRMKPLEEREEPRVFKLN